MVESLIVTLLTLAGWLSPQQARIHVEAAIQASDETGIDAETLLAMAYMESRYVPNVVSYLDCSDRCETDPTGAKRCARSCIRRGSRIRSLHKPANWQPTFFCGPVQVTAKSWNDCKQLTSNIFGSYSRAADHLRGWLVHGDRRFPVESDQRLLQALAGYGGGFVALKKRNFSYPRKVLRLRSRIKRISTDYEQRRVHSPDI